MRGKSVLTPIAIFVTASTLLFAGIILGGLFLMRPSPAEQTASSEGASGSRISRITAVEPDQTKATTAGSGSQSTSADVVTTTIADRDAANNGVERQSRSTGLKAQDAPRNNPALAAAAGSPAEDLLEWSDTDRRSTGDEFAVGFPVIVVRDTRLLVDARGHRPKFSVPLHVGVPLKIEEIAGDRIWVSQTFTGWVNRIDVATPREAMTVFSERIRQDSQDGPAYRARAAIREIFRDLQGAVADFDEALRSNPADDAIYLARGECRKAMGDFEGAIADCGLLIQRRPSEAMGYVNRSDMWARLGEFDQAESDATEGLKHASGIVAAYVNRGWARTGKKQFELAMKDLNAALRIDPRQAYTYAFRGTAFAGLGDYVHAGEDFAQAISLDAKDEFVCQEFARFLATCPDKESRDGQKAVRYARRACAASHWKEAGRLDTLAAAYAEAGNFEAAIKWQDQALRLARESQKPDFQKHLSAYTLKTPWRA